MISCQAASKTEGVQVRNRKEKSSSAYVARFNGDVPGAADACWVVRVGPVWRLDGTPCFGQPSTTELVLCRNRKMATTPHLCLLSATRTLMRNHQRTSERTVT